VVERKFADYIRFFAYNGEVSFEALFIIRQPPCIGDAVHLICAVIPLKFDDLHLGIVEMRDNFDGLEYLYLCVSHF